MIRLLAIAIGLISGCASNPELRCKPSDNKIALCQTGSHEVCETQSNGCERCTCVPDRFESLDHGPVAPQR